MFNSRPRDNVPAWMSSAASGASGKILTLHTAEVEEELGELTRMTVYFNVDAKITPDTFVGEVISVHVEAQRDKGRSFSGICISARTEIEGNTTDVWAEVRPWPWLMTRKVNTRIFQDKSAKDIISEVLGEADLSDFALSLSGTFAKRTYCVQYRESDFDFVSRLMEEEGIYYFFPFAVNEKEPKSMKLGDGAGAHQAIPLYSTIEFWAGDSIGGASDDQITSWARHEKVIPGEVKLNDYAYITPQVDVTNTSIIPKGKHNYKTNEIYDHPGRQVDLGEHVSSWGDDLAKYRMEAHVAEHEVWQGETGARMMGIGQTFKLDNHPDSSANKKEYLVTQASHRIMANDGRHFQYNSGDDAVYRCSFKAILKTVQYRSRRKTQRPSVPGIQTALVVGPSGEEIYTDENGRIKVLFHWDRLNEKDETASCWVRVVTPWAGAKWGMVHIPRIGQEVVIQFEEGDPDRPVCTGMLYNGDNMHPYDLPANKTQSGIKTLSSKGGSVTQNFNELMFEDKKDAELLRMQAQKDHEFLIKDRATITVGFDELAEADTHEGFSISTVVKQNVSETITDGDKFRTIETGSETIKIKKDKTQTVEGKHTKTITGNDTTTVKTGNLTTTVNTGNMATTVKTGNQENTVKTGNQTNTVSMGNYSNTVKMGNITVEASLGQISMEALQKIELKVGTSKITLDPSGVTIEGIMINVKATAMTEVKSPMTTVKGDAMLTLKGGVTMIN